MALKKMGKVPSKRSERVDCPFFLNTMWLFSIYKLLYPKPKYVWGQVRILHETKKAILVKNVEKLWIPKSQIRKIRLRNNVFEIYVREGMFG